MRKPGLSKSFVFVNNFKMRGAFLRQFSSNSSSTAASLSLASQIRRVFTARRLPSLPATLRELWYRVLVSGFVMGTHKTKEDARFCGHCERTCRTRSKKRPPLRRYHTRFRPMPSGSIRMGPRSLLVVPTYGIDFSLLAVESGPGSYPRFQRPGLSPASGLRFRNPDLLRSPPGALGFPPMLRTEGPI